MTTLGIIGAGGHGREAHATALAAGGWSEISLYDDAADTNERLERLGLVIAGPVTASGTSDEVVIAIGDPTTRRSIDDRLGEHRGAIIIDPSARIGTDVDLGPGTMVYAQAAVTTNVRIGRHSHVNCGAVVSHDVRIGDHVSVSPGALLNGGVVVEDGAFLGTGAIVIPGVRIGQGAVVGAGAVVTSDVAAGSTVVGVPAR